MVDSSLGPRWAFVPAVTENPRAAEELRRAEVY
jgi:hypothetical protein